MRRLIAPVAALALLAACQQAEAPAAPAAEASAAPEATPPTPSEPPVTPPPLPLPAPGTEPVSCADERGQAAAQALADQCRQVSPATRPPCHPANPCAMIQAEIDRSCALWAEDDDVPAECGG